MNRAVFGCTSPKRRDTGTPGRSGAVNHATTPGVSFGQRPWWRSKFSFALAGTAVALTVGALVVCGYRLYAARQELADAIAETDRLDPGWRLHDLEAQRLFPPVEQNAALQVFKVMSLIPQGWRPRLAGPQDGEPVEVDGVLRDLSPVRQLDERHARPLR